MPTPPEDIMKGLAAYASSGTLDQGKRFLVTEAAALIKYQQFRLQEAENKQREALRMVDDIKAVNETLKLRMAGMVALQDYFRKQLQEMIRVELLTQPLAEDGSEC